MKRIVAPLLATALLAGCGGRALESSPAETSVAPTATRSLDNTNGVILDSVFKANGSEWPIVCYGPLTGHRAKRGDTLVKLIFRHTEVHQSASLDQSDIPADAIAQAVAKIDGVPNRNLILAGVSYGTPASCEPGVLHDIDW